MARPLTIGEFPIVERSVQGSWAPVFIEPLLGSGERIAVAVVAANTDAFFVARANRLDRLKCLYGVAADAVAFAAETSLDAFEEVLTEQGLRGMREPHWVFASVSLGPIQQARGASLQDIAWRWLAFTSSLYEQPLRDPLTLAATEIEARDEIITAGVVKDRLPKLVFDYVVSRNPRLSKAFGDSVLQAAQGTRRRRSHEINIDFYGSKIVANLGTLVAGGVSGSVERLKRKMWDLKVARDRLKSPLFSVSHEMLVQHPANDDPQLSQRQIDNLNEALEELEKQADLEELRFRPLTSVADIGEHILKAEVAA